MNSLPVEILKMIVDQVPAGVDLRSIRALNRTFCELSTPRVFRRILVKNTTWHAEAFESVVQSKAAILYLEEIVFQDIYVEKDGNFMDVSPSEQVRTESSHYAREIRESLSSTFSRLHELPALKTLVLLFFPQYAEERYWEVYEPSEHLHLQLAILSGLSHPPSFSLTSLTITGLIAVHNELFDTLPFRSLFERLAYLRIAAVSDTYYHENFVGFWEKTISQRILEPRVSLAQSLTSLTIHSDQEVGFIPAIDFSQLTYSSLTYLSLKYILFDEVSMNVEDFIVRHGGTLKTLELQFCRIAVHDPEQGPTRFWSQIWHRFSVKMGALMKLNVKHFYRRNSERMLKYVYLDEGHGYNDLFDAVPGEELDKPALKALDGLLDSRRSDQRSI